MITSAGDIAESFRVHSGENVRPFGVDGLQWAFVWSSSRLAAEARGEAQVARLDEPVDRAELHRLRRADYVRGRTPSEPDRDQFFALRSPQGDHLYIEVRTEERGFEVLLRASYVIFHFVVD